MTDPKRQKQHTAPRHLKAPEPPRRAARAEKTAAHRGTQTKRSKRPVTAAAPRQETQSYSDRRLYDEKLLPYSEARHQANQRSLRTCIGWLFALPLILLLVQKLTDQSKIGILLVWIVGMFVISAAVLYIAYSDHELQTYLRSLAEFVPDVEEPSLGNLLPVDENGNWTISAEQRRKSASRSRAEQKKSEASIRPSRKQELKRQQHGEEGKHAKHSAHRS